MKQILGKLKKIDLRKAWEHEALDFTKWLAMEDNLALLSEEIGVNLNLIETIVFTYYNIIIKSSQGGFIYEGKLYNRGRKAYRNSR